MFLKSIDAFTHPKIAHKIFKMMKLWEKKCSSRILHLTNSNEKSTMNLIYKAINQVKENMQEAFSDIKK
ncbi:hypothetical protein CR513_26811, partial [Mucuna pruriens]